MKFHHTFFHNFRRKLAINVVLAIGSSLVTPALLGQSHSFGTEVAAATAGSHDSAARTTGKTVWPASDGQYIAPSTGEDSFGVQCGVVKDDSPATPLIAFDAGEDYSGPQAATAPVKPANASYGSSSSASGGVK